ncbi:MAG: transcription elongation factor GreA [Proteobacteria bacterium]|nr:transcription elongation factor GreA [Pseudomonadota bacterium]
MNKEPITIEGYRALQAELKQLIAEERPKIINAISDARAHGDLKENAEYHAAKEKQGFIEGRIQRINFILSNSETIDVVSIASDKVRFGATVTYEDMETEEETTWKIVGEEETDIKNRKISIKSPIAKALMGKQEGDETMIRAPKGNKEIEITKIQYI